ncbi:MAG: glycosyltransferase, partial [Gammaproteobacteria bacterium]
MAAARPAAGPGRPLTVVQLLPALEAGGVERGTVEVARHLAAQGHRAVVVSAGGRLVAELEAAGVEHLAWPVGVKGPQVLRWLPRLRRLLRERRPDVLHLRSRLPAWLGWWAWRSLPEAERPALVTTVHGYYSPGRYSGVMARGERVIAISRGVREHLLRHWPRTEPARVRVIPRGVDPGRYPRGYRPPEAWLARWRRERPELAGRWVLTLPARLTRWKGQEDFLELLARLAGQGLPVHGLIAGGAHPRKAAYARELEARARALGLAGRVSFLSHREDLREVLAVSDVVLSLSREPEAFGRTTLEALALGRPVLGYAHGGVGEQLAALFPQGAVPPGALAEAARRLAAWHRSP